MKRLTQRRPALAALVLLVASAAVFLSLYSPVASAQGGAPASAATATTTRGAAGGGGGGSATANPVVLVIVLGALALAPFALIMLTSFVKISVVLSILRNALGTQQVPPNQVITGISLILTVFIMAPVVEKMYAEAGQVGDTEAIFSEVSVKTIFEAAKRGREPLRQFLERHAHERDRKMFFDLAQRMAIRNGNDPAEILVTDFRTVIPAFVTSELTEAFQIGFLLFIPFLIIDMVVSNILQAMGMFMLSPAMISLPFKLLLFVLIDGWVILIRNLVMGYT
ncbi:MAG TPA: type III secretion system export apparatus subunit SctR [Pyrinomonadaceae bacterium]|nr:type III secretion system export apparatus subunit SctR [Pyrinomonadaceae bacterium]